MTRVQSKLHELIKSLDWLEYKPASGETQTVVSPEAALKLAELSLFPTIAALLLLLLDITNCLFMASNYNVVVSLSAQLILRHDKVSIAVHNGSRRVSDLALVRSLFNPCGPRGQVIQ